METGGRWVAGYFHLTIQFDNYLKWPKVDTKTIVVFWLDIISFPELTEWRYISTIVQPTERWIPVFPMMPVMSFPIGERMTYSVVPN